MSLKKEVVQSGDFNQKRKSENHHPGTKLKITTCIILYKLGDDVIHVALCRKLSQLSYEFYMEILNALLYKPPY
jgi:hypothetical protein